MKTLLVFACLLMALSVKAAVPTYQAFRGTGGITITSNPPNGTIVIDGSGIVAGAFPDYGITNRYSATFTNLGNMRLVGTFHFGSGFASNSFLYLNGLTNVAAGTFGSGFSFVGGTVAFTNTIVDALTNRNASRTWTNLAATRLEGAVELGSTVIATNGNIQLLNDGFWAVIGPPLGQGAATLTNNAGTYQQGQLIMNVSGSSLEISGGAFQSIKTGSTLRIESGGVLDLDHLFTNSILWIGAGGILSTAKFGANISISADGTLSASGGSGTPGGATGQVQFNEGGAFDATNTYIFNRAVNALIIGTGSSSGFSNRVTESSIITMGVGSTLFLGSAGVTNARIAGASGALTSHGGTNTLGGLGIEWQSIHGLRYTGGWTNMGSNAAVTAVWEMGRQRLTYSASGNSTINVTNVPASGSAGVSALEFDLYFPAGQSYTLTMNLVDAKAINWNGDGGPIIVAGITNRVWLDFNGTNVVGRSAQVATSGTLGSPPVFLTQTSPAILGTETVNASVHTNGIGYAIGTIAGVGGANTNFTLSATYGVRYIDGGTTNVNIVASMPGTVGIQYFPTVIISNLTTTVRLLSWSVVTNQLINLQQYDGVTLPITISNKHTAILAYTQQGSNCMWSLKQATNGF